MLVFVYLMVLKELTCSRESWHFCMALCLAKGPYGSFAQGKVETEFMLGREESSDKFILI